MRKFILIFIALFSAIFIAGCQSNSNGSDAPQAADTTQTQEAPVSLNGTWTAEGFVAEIGDDSITINLVGVDSSALYWKGTFPATGDTVVSKADVEALSMSMMGSTDTEKTFTVAGDEISFPMSMMGVDTVVRLTR